MEKNKKQTSIKAIMAIFVILIIVFLALPIIFQEEKTALDKLNKQQKALPLKTQNPFTHYFNLFKQFYTPKNKEFKKLNNSLLAKKEADTIKNTQQNTYPAVSVASAGQTQPQQENNYYEENKNYSAQPYIEPEQKEDTFVPQEPFEDFLVEGLYETSQLAPIETKLLARKKVFDILTPKPFTLLPSTKEIEKTLTNSSPLQVKTNAQESKTILFNDNSNTNKISTAAGNYINGIFSPFSKNNSATMGKIDINGLPFETQSTLVASRLNTIHHQNSSGKNNNSSQGSQNNGENPKPPLPPKDTFDPTKWETEVNTSCDMEKMLNTEQQNNLAKQPVKIDTCDPDISQKLAKVNEKMQKEHQFLIVSGRYKGKIMIPTTLSLPEKVLTSIASDEEGIFTLNLPRELRGKQFSKNTEKTEFNFVSALKPEVFEKLMKDEKTILLSVDTLDLLKHPQNTILIQSGEIETYLGADKIIKDINNFPTKQAEIKKMLKQKETEDKKQKAQDLQNKINSAI
ncbi:MAG: hypothetical protein II972_01385 [Elusimicrobiaceae bacterium]|nr:hypothetical protein [Elusimicrobiaceae bacterium]MBQ6223652.1 hypothetical protein [Campylobacter sp.]